MLMPRASSSAATKCSSVANFRAVYSVGKAIADYLDQNYPAELKDAGLRCSFRSVASAEIATEDVHQLDQTVSVFLHRITRNEQLRSPSRLVGRPDQQPTLFLDLHYLLTYWGASAEAEQTILGWVMQQIEINPVLDSAILSKSAGWDATETVQLIPANLSLEDVLRIWDALGPKYRLSIGYLARFVRVDRQIVPAGPVVATRFQLDAFSPEADA
jgi:hypothetical protein